jgi:MinD-like ATPase involved in chromosome partitioning or flagellar assembly
MALVALASAKGAPGVTTLAVALAGVHPGAAVVAETDPAGGDLAWRYGTAEGQPLDTGRGLLSLAAVIRHGATDLRPHLQTVAGGLPVLVGVTTPEQVTGLGPVWSQIAHTLATLPGADVFADCGRVTSGSPSLPVMLAADAVVLTARPEVDQLAHLRERVRMLAEQTGAGAVRPPIGVVVVAGEKDHRLVVGDVQRLLDAAGLPGKVLGAVAHDERGARLLAGSGGGSAGRTPLVRSVRALSPALAALAAQGVATRGPSLATAPGRSAVPPTVPGRSAVPPTVPGRSAVPPTVVDQWTHG